MINSSYIDTIKSYETIYNSKKTVVDEDFTETMKEDLSNALYNNSEQYSAVLHKKYFHDDYPIYSFIVGFGVMLVISRLKDSKFILDNDNSALVNLLIERIIINKLIRECEDYLYFQNLQNNIKDNKLPKEEYDIIGNIKTKIEEELRNEYKFL